MPLLNYWGCMVSDKMVSKKGNVNLANIILPIVNILPLAKRNVIGLLE